MKQLKTQYIINYDKYHVFDGREGYLVLQGKTCDSIKELQDYIREHVTPKDRNIYIVKKEIYRYDLKEFMSLQEEE